ncbi:non-hydrolyzing UDP-N-acetylglucosamine 2-epimerase [Kineococcus sp. SYSU DK002]|uniref:non-hydrolyzing UDP-N-acetylglucosamine 2-epimerase n=1 Tax=Kineococcus sp. SYSU DK002 TaxID=3383123 RepID=UPI003D7D1F02
MADESTDLSGKVAVVFGTRPEIIKQAPVLHALGADGAGVFTGQHYDPELTDAVFRSCGLEPLAPAVDGVGGGTRAQQVATMVDRLADRFTRQRPRAVVVQGDTNTANAGAQAGHYLGIPVVHVEAGLRSHDRAMPEETNRLLISALADVHCAATPENARNLLDGAVPAGSVFVTGNPVVEAVTALCPSEEETAGLLAGLGVAPGGVVATVHRPENTDDPHRLRTLVAGLGELGAPVALPLHPRTRKALGAWGVTVPAAVRVLPPVDYRTFLALTRSASLLVSDSGGLQEEVTVLKKPLVVVRTSTERPESVAAGFSVLSEPEDLVGHARRMTSPQALARLADTPSPYGDGLASQRIAALARDGAPAPQQV